jgi:hypothetical protein
MLETSNLEINRIIIHRVHKKLNEDDFGYAEYSENLFDFGAIELETLKDRIKTAFSKSKRFFKLEISQFGENSFYGYSKALFKSTDETFITNSKSIADLLAISHNKRTIPSGLLLIIEGQINNKQLVLVIKAELQEAFTIKDNDKNKLVELITDLFLSPAKDFYKIGLIIEDINTLTHPNDKFSCYMYDDNFTSGKRDLAEYFYGTFLGFTTNRNDKLITKNFKDDFYRFVDTHVVGFENKRGLKHAIISLYRENITGVVNPQEFAETHLPNDLLRLYGSEISSNYPQSFVKDLSLVDKSLERGQIRLVDDLKIEGPIESIDNVSISNASNFNIDQLKFQIENGDIKQIVTIKADRN